MSNLRGLFKLYQDVLRRRPYLVQAVQTGALMGSGDLISQTLIERKSITNVDYMRTLKFSSIGFFVGVSNSIILLETIDLLHKMLFIIMFLQNRKTLRHYLKIKYLFASMWVP